MERILLVETPDYNNDKYIDTKKLYNKNLYEFHKRYVKMKTKINNKFQIKLFGFDNTVKNIYKKMNVKKIFKNIDDMPMGKLRKKVNLSLYSNYNPKTTVTGLGYKDKKVAENTIKKINKYPIDYQVRVINTMYNRAKYHVNQTKDMRDAMKVFKNWLDKYKKKNK